MSVSDLLGPQSGGTTSIEVFDLTVNGTLEAKVVGSGVVAWSPVLAFGGASVGLTYTVQQGTYIKIGQMVSVAWTIAVNNIGSSTGAATVSLPFATLAAPPTEYQCAIPVYSEITFSAGYDAVGSFAAAGAQVLQMRQSGPASVGADVALTDANFQNGSTIAGAFVYFSA
jgi:hypothetical protein